MISRKQILLAFSLAVLVLAAGFLIFRHQPGANNQQAADLLITHATIVTMDEKLDVFKDGWLAVKDQKIFALGQGQPNVSAKEEINASGEVLLPGLINSHTHAAMVLEQGLGQGLKLSDWLVYLAGIEKNFTKEDVYWGSLQAEGQMLRTGTTAYNDMYFFPKSTAKAAALAGIKALVRVPVESNGTNLLLDQNFLQTDEHSSLVRLSLAPNPLLSYSLAELQQFAQWSVQSGLPLHIHFEEQASERQSSLQKFSQTPAQLLNSTGLINQPLILAHGGDLTLAELDDLAKRSNIGFSVTPVSEQALGDPLPKVDEMLTRGIKVALGTDSEPSGGSLDMFLQLRAAAQMFSCNPKENFCSADGKIKPQEILKMATSQAAAVLGWQAQTGSLEPGKDADLILIKLSSTNQSQDIFGQLVYNTSGEAVSDVWVNGQRLLKKGQLQTLDQALIDQNISAIRRRLGIIK